MDETHLDERLDFAPLRQLLRTHTLRHFQRVALNARHDCVGVRSLLCTLIQLLDNNDLLACLAASKHNCDLEVQRYVILCITSCKYTITPFRACILRAWF